MPAGTVCAPHTGRAYVKPKDMQCPAAASEDLQVKACYTSLSVAMLSVLKYTITAGLLCRVSGEALIYYIQDNPDSDSSHAIFISHTYSNRWSHYAEAHCESSCGSDYYGGIRCTRVIAIG